jgi:alpha/beta superfamily hydrolase
MKFLGCLIAILALHIACVAQKTGVDLDIAASDGAKLKATYYSAGKPGPGMLLLHQCNMNRKAWNNLAEALAQRGVHVLTFDYRGYGETSGPGSRDKLSTDIDTALATLKSKGGVDKTRLAAGGASCSVENAVQLARRSEEIKALLLLTGPVTASGREFFQSHISFPVYWADSPEMGYKAVIKSTNSATTTRDVAQDWHGVVMFDRDASILITMADWVAKVLR